jgi:hypothetical protein
LERSQLQHNKTFKDKNSLTRITSDTSTDKNTDTHSTNADLNQEKHTQTAHNEAQPLCTAAEKKHKTRKQTNK